MADASYADLLDAVRRRPPRAALVLGSGLAGLASQARMIAAAAYPRVPGLPAPTTPGHEGRLIFAEWAGQPVLIFAGRLHRYEGHPWRRVVELVHVALELDAPILLLTNAAGGIRADLAPGAMMLLRDHIDATTIGWWRCAAARQATARSPYSVALFSRLCCAARRCREELTAGVYAQVSGPCYETKAEIRALARCGVDAVGMSTAREVRLAAALGVQCAAISCITNRAAGLCDGPITHDDVLREGPQFERRLGRLLGVFFATLNDPLTYAGEPRPGMRRGVSPT